MEAQPIGDILPQIIQNSVQATQELKKHLSGDVRKFYLALSSQLVKDSTLVEVKDVLRKILFKLGVRSQNWPNELEQLCLYEHIVEHYGGHRLNELPLAFDMAIVGGLCDSDGVVVDANCYENFSCIYFSKIMNAYRVWSRSEYRILPTSSKPENEKQKIFSQEELDDYARETCEWEYQMFLRGIELSYPESNRAILIRDGLIKEGELAIDFFKKRAEKQILHIYEKKV